MTLIHSRHWVDSTGKLYLAAAGGFSYSHGRDKNPHVGRDLPRMGCRVLGDDQRGICFLVFYLSSLVGLLFLFEPCLMTSFRGSNFPFSSLSLATAPDLHLTPTVAFRMSAQSLPHSVCRFLVTRRWRYVALQCHIARCYCA